MSRFEIVQTLIASWREKDVEAVLKLVADDLEYHYLVGMKPLNGKQEMRAFLEKFGGDQSNIQWRIIHHAENGDVLMVEGVDDYVDGKGRHIQTPYMGIFEFSGDKIHRWRDYLDPALIKQDKLGEEKSEWLTALTERGS